MSHPMLRECFLRADYLAERWQISTKTLANLRCRRQGPTFVRPLGTSIRYALADVETYELAGRVELVAAWRTSVTPHWKQTP